MHLEHATVEDICDHLSKQGLHGVIAVNGFLVRDLENNGKEPIPGIRVGVIGHPVAALGLAHEAVRRAENKVDKLYENLYE